MPAIAPGVASHARSWPRPLRRRRHPLPKLFRTPDVIVPANAHFLVS
ncbi:hypothetical protein ACFOEY_08005 [Paracandidimonas soli]